MRHHLDRTIDPDPLRLISAGSQLGTNDQKNELRKVADGRVFHVCAVQKNRGYVLNVRSPEMGLKMSETYAS